MKFPQAIGITVAVVALAGAVRWAVVSRTGEPSAKDGPPRSVSPSPSAAGVNAQVDAALAAVSRASAGESRAAVAELKASLMALPPEEAVGRIRELLESGTDKEIGSAFELDSNGDLRGAPTLRTLLLDLVAAIDPEAAAAISIEILDAPTTADEWAIALRNIGRFEDSPEALELLESKTVELIRNPEWQADPSIGYLNAFDVLVHSRATDQTPLLSELIRNKDRKDLAHAAFLTLDRLVQQQPVEMLERVANDAALAAIRPEMAAQQIARADLRDDRQRELVKSWLLDPDRTPTELRSFASVYPNSNQFVSNNLLTRDAPYSGADLAAHDRAALKIVTEWTESPELTPVKPHLSLVIRRLSEFTNSSSETSLREPEP